MSAGAENNAEQTAPGEVLGFASSDGSSILPISTTRTLILIQSERPFVLTFVRVLLTRVIVYYDLLMGEKIDGKAVTEEQISQWVREAEDGYDAALLKKRGRGRPGRGAQPSQVVAVRFTPEEIAELDRRAQSREMSRSELIREAALL